MERQPRFEAQRVAGAETGRRDARGHDRVPCGGRRRRGHVDLDAVFARVARAGDSPLAHRCDFEARHRGRVVADRREQLPRLRALHRQHRAR